MIPKLKINQKKQQPQKLIYLKQKKTKLSHIKSNWDNERNKEGGNKMSVASFNALVPATTTTSHNYS